MASTKYFKSVNYIHPDPISPGQKNVRVEWLFEDLTKDQIDLKENGNYAVIPGCGCTANIEVLDDRIVATYSDTTTEKKVRESQNRELQIGKNLRVYLKDGKPLRAKNDRGVMGWNVKGKENVILAFTVIVQV